MHAAIVDDSGERDGEPVLPFVWNDVTLHATGATRLRVHIGQTGSAADNNLSDETSPTRRGILFSPWVLWRVRPVSVGQLGSVAGGGVERLLWRVDWVSAPVSGDGVEGVGGSLPVWDEVPAGGEVPPVVVWEVPAVGGDVPVRARGVVGLVLERVGRWLSDARFAGSRLVVVTRGAVALPGDAGVELGVAGVWGVFRGRRRRTRAGSRCSTSSPVGMSGWRWGRLPRGRTRSRCVGGGRCFRVWLGCSVRGRRGRSSGGLLPLAVVGRCW